MTDQHELLLAPVDVDPEAASAQAEALADATERGRWPLRLLELADVAELMGDEPTALALRGDASRYRDRAMALLD